MNSNDLITLKAFLTALTQMNEPLPGDIQTQLNQIGKILEVDPTNIGNLDALARSYQPLKQIYQKERIALIEAAGERSKGLPPLRLDNKPTKEITNIAIPVFGAKNSVAAVQKATQSKNPFKWIGRFIKGSH